MRWRDEDRTAPPKKPQEGSGRRFGISSRAKKIRLACKDRLFPAVYAKEARSGIWREARELPDSGRHSSVTSPCASAFGSWQTPQCPRHGLRKNTPGFRTITSHRPPHLNWSLRVKKNPYGNSGGARPTYTGLATEMLVPRKGDAVQHRPTKDVDKAAKETTGYPPSRARLKQV